MRFRLRIISAVLLVVFLASPALALTKHEVWASIQLYVKDRLLAPDEAKFPRPPWHGKDGCFWTDFKDGEWFARSYVTAPNAYGQKIRQYFTAYVGSNGSNLYMKEFRWLQ